MVNFLYPNQQEKNKRKLKKRTKPSQREIVEKVKKEKKSHLNCLKKNKMPRNKLNQGGNIPVLWKW